jgi:hypothetical protein
MDPPIMGSVTHQKAVNIYIYNPRNLWLAYGIAIMATFFAVTIDLIAHTSNGGTHDRSFSSFLCATRNTDLDNLVLRSSTDTSDLWNSKISTAELEKTKLRFGRVDSGGEGQMADRVYKAFGFKGTVQ